MEGIPIATMKRSPSASMKRLLVGKRKKKEAGMQPPLQQPGIACCQVGLSRIIKDILLSRRGSVRARWAWSWKGANGVGGRGCGLGGDAVAIDAWRLGRSIDRLMQ